MSKDKIVVILDNIVLYSLYGIAFYIPISKGIIESLCYLAIVCFIVKKIILRQGLKKNGFNFAILLYLTTCFISIIFSSNPFASLRTFFAKSAQNTALFLVVAEALNSERKLKNIIYVFLASSFIVGIDGVYQHFTHKDFIRHRPYYDIPRIHASFTNSNGLGCYLAAIIPFIIACFFDKLKSWGFRIIYTGLFALLFACLILTGSRGAWIASISSMMFMSLWLKSLGILFLFLLVAIFLSRQFFDPFLKWRLNQFLNSYDVDTDRRIIWQAGWRMFTCRPWLGVGLGTFMFNFKRFVSEGYPHGVPYAHNCYLQIAAEIGIPGVAAFLLLLGLFFFKGVFSLKNRQRDFSWLALLASIASVLGYSVQMSVDTTFYSLDLGILFWLMLGMGTALINNLNQGQVLKGKS